MENRFSRYVLGPFSIDTSERLLRRKGEVFALAPKGVEILLLLVERPGELVTKEELRERIWDSAFVEENSVTQTVSRLRRALGPDFPGENPIIAVSKRGYRLGVAVTVESPAPAVDSPLAKPSDTPFPALSDSTAEPAGLGVQLEVQPALGVVKPIPHRRQRGVFVQVGLVAVVAIAVAFLSVKHFRRHALSPPTPAPKQERRRAVAVLGFRNLSGRADDAWLGTALAEMMNAELLADGAVRVVPNSVVAQVERSAATSSTPGPSPEVVVAAGKALNCDYVLSGDYLETGGKLRFDVAVQDVHTGETLGAFTRTDLADHLLALVALTGEDVRHGLGTRPLSPVETGQVLASVASNPDALRSYAQGLTLLRSLNAVGARPYLEEAIRLEPDYPLSHAALSYAWGLLGYDAKAVAEANRATELTSNLSSEEKLEVEARYDEASMQWDKAAGTYQQLWTQYPDEIEYGLGLGHALNSAGKAEQALEVVRKLHDLESQQGSDPRIDLMESVALTSLSRYALAAKAADTARDSAKVRGDTFVLIQALMQSGTDANFLGDPVKARAAFSEAGQLAGPFGDSGAKTRAMAADAQLVLQTGDAETAKREDLAAIALAKQIGDRRELVHLLLDMTQVYRPEGNLMAQREYAQQALRLSEDIADRASQATALLDLGNALNNQGSVDAARAAYEQCIALTRSMGSRGMLSKALGNLAIVEYTHGNLVKAQALLEEGIDISRSTGEKASVAYKLGQYATVLMYENRLAQARAALQERYDIETQLGAQRELAVCQISMAELAIAEGHPQDAVAPLTKITETYNQVNPAANAWEMLAQAQLALHNTKAVGEAIDHAEKLGQDTKNPAEFRIPMGLITGRYQAAMGNDAAALRMLKSSRDGANALKLLPIALRAELYIAEVDSKKKPSVAASEFDQVARESEHAGFLRIVALARSESGRNSLIKAN